ncbi:reverse transcriptase domain-containing protein [Patescibacteria group bacterium]
MRKIFIHTYNDIISVENLLEGWSEFLGGKRSRDDVQKFEQNLMLNIIDLHNVLVNKTYKHSKYEAFNISDPKPRNIHKAKVRDRLLHHAIYRKLYPFFDSKFIADSYSCRNEKGTHRAINRLRDFTRIVSKNNTKTVWVLKCDIRKFFASIDHEVLIKIINKYILDKQIIWLLSVIIRSFHATERNVGLPLGNLTSQLFVNIYMNEFDQFMKHKIKAKYYIRYADDFVILSHYKDWLELLLPQIKTFLSEELKLELHPKKVSIETIASGVDFLGWIHFPRYRILRTVTKRRIFRGIQDKNAKPKTVQSYLGLISHGNSKKIQQKIENFICEINSFYFVEK